MRLNYVYTICVFYEMHVRERDIKNLIVLYTLCTTAQVHIKRVHEVTTRIQYPSLLCMM
jgi:hypothetical protein